MRELKSQLVKLAIEPISTKGYFPASESEMQALEEELGDRLPADYRWFLGRYGYSSFNNAVSYPSSVIPGGYSVGSSFGSNESGHGVLANYIAHKGQFARGIVPIGEASLGDLFLLALTGPNRGNVCYWCHDGVGWEGEAEEYRGRGQAVP